MDEEKAASGLRSPAYLPFAGGGYLPLARSFVFLISLVVFMSFLLTVMRPYVAVFGRL